MARIYRHPNSEKWFLDYYDRYGKRVRRAACSDKSSAQQMLAAAVKAVERQKAGLAQADPRFAQQSIETHVEDYLRELERRGRSAKYRYNIRKHIEAAMAFGKWSRIGDGSPESIRSYLHCVAEAGRTPKTINEHRSDLSAFFAWCVKTDRMVTNPCDDVERVEDRRDKTRRALSIDELQRLIQAAPPHRSLVYWFLACTGIRRGEAKQLMWSHVHLRGEHPYVELPASITKSGQPEAVPMVPDLAAAMKKASRSPHRNGKLFYAIPEMPTFRRDLKRAEIEVMDDRGREVVLHSLRHSLATMLAHSGVPIAIAQRIMRHRDIRLTTEAYTDAELLPVAASMRGLPQLRMEAGDRTDD